MSQFGAARPRIASVTIDLLTSPTAGIYTSAFNLDIGGRVKVTDFQRGPLDHLGGLHRGVLPRSIRPPRFLSRWTRPRSPPVRLCWMIQSSAGSPQTGKRLPESTPSLRRWRSVLIRVLLDRRRPAVRHRGRYRADDGYRRDCTVGRFANADCYPRVNCTTATAHNYGEQVNIANEIVLGY